jgi:hypothetical protein
MLSQGTNKIAKKRRRVCLPLCYHAFDAGRARPISLDQALRLECDVADATRMSRSLVAEGEYI